MLKLEHGMVVIFSRYSLNANRIGKIKTWEDEVYLEISGYTPIWKDKYLTGEEFVLDYDAERIYHNGRLIWNSPYKDVEMEPEIWDDV